LIRPVARLEENHIAAGTVFHMTMEELGLDGPAEVVAVEPCPAVEPGRGRVITGRFTTTRCQVLDLRLVGVEEVLHPTPSHLFASVDRGEWVPAEELRVGECVRTLSGRVVTVDSIRLNPEPQRVYNYEIEGEHHYFVGECGVLVHNMCQTVEDGAEGREAQSSVTDFTDELSVSSDVARARLRSALGLGRGDADEAHHLTPLELTEHEVVRRAAKAGFNFNGEVNGIAISFDRHRGENIFHHNKYNAAVESKLNRMLAANPSMSNNEAASLLQAYMEQLRNGISRSTGRLR
jgi:hypothetical protein